MLTDEIEETLTETEWGHFETIIEAPHDLEKWLQMNALYFQIGKTTLGESMNLDKALKDYDDILTGSYEGEPVDKGLMDRGY